MEKSISVVSALVLAAILAGIAFLSAPVWVLLIPLWFVDAKEADASDASCVPQQGFRYLVPSVLCACLVAGTGLLYTSVSGFSSMVNGIGIAIGLLPASYF